MSKSKKKKDYRKYLLISVVALALTVCGLNLCTGSSTKIFASSKGSLAAVGGLSTTTPALYHSADLNQNYKIEKNELDAYQALFQARQVSLKQLLRVIQFYNSCHYKVEVGTQDGFAPDCVPECSLGGRCSVGVVLSAPWATSLWYPDLSKFKFVFTLRNNNNFNYYISRDPSIAVSTSTVSSYPITPRISEIYAGQDSFIGDSWKAYVIPAGSYRTFELSGSISPSEIRDLQTIFKITSIKYGRSTTTLALLTAKRINDGLSNLSVYLIPHP